MKIAVYTIALNELAHCERWANSVRDADYLVVLDTGSTDGTQAKLRELGVTVYEQKIVPWRFDSARNAALTVVPNDADICVSMDMDEFMEPNWRTEIERSWLPNTTRLSYNYVFDYHPNQTNRAFYADKIHARHGYIWRRPVHETVFAVDINEVLASNSNVIMNQIQDRSKTTRSNYLPLMKIAHDEDPGDSQTAFWYGRELMYANDFSEATTILTRYLSIPSSRWHVERSEALIYLHRMNPDKSWLYLSQATYEAPTRREVWLEVAQDAYNKSDWKTCLWAALNGIEKSVPQGSYLDRQEAWGSQLADLGSLAAFNLGWVSKAVELCKAAVGLNPTDDRLKNNLKLMENSKET